MTVVAAIAKASRVWMAADTCTNYAGTDMLGARKIRRITVGQDEALLAAAGNGAILAAAQRGLDITDTPDPDDDRAVAEWADEVAVSATENLATLSPSLLDEDSHDKRIDGAYLLAWRGRLIYLWTHQALVVPPQPSHGAAIAGLGVGTDLALGVMHTGLGYGSNPDILVRQAVEQACDRYQGCRVGEDGPLIETLDNRAMEAA